MTGTSKRVDAKKGALPLTIRYYIGGGENIFCGHI